MLNFIAKAAAGTAIGCTVPKLVNKTLPILGEYYDTSVKFITDLFSNDEDTPPNKNKPKQPKNKLTPYQYDIIMRAYEFNNSIPKEQKINQQILCDKLNAQLGLNYTRSGYAHYFRKRLIPDFAKGNDYDR